MCVDRGGGRLWAHAGESGARGRRVRGSAGREAHAIAMYGEPKYPAGFAHFDYTNPDAPKGGSLCQGALGTFDSYNRFIIV